MIKHRYCLVTNMVGMFLDLMNDIVDSTTALCPATFDCPSTLKPQPLSRNYVIFSRDPRPRIHRAPRHHSCSRVKSSDIYALCFRPLLERNCNFSRVRVVSCENFRNSFPIFLSSTRSFKKNFRNRGKNSFRCCLIWLCIRKNALFCINAECISMEDTMRIFKHSLWITCV